MTKGYEPRYGLIKPKNESVKILINDPSLNVVMSYEKCVVNLYRHKHSSNVRKCKIIFKGTF